MSDLEYFQNQHDAFQQKIEAELRSQLEATEEKLNKIIEFATNARNRWSDSAERTNNEQIRRENWRYAQIYDSVLKLIQTLDAVECNEPKQITGDVSSDDSSHGAIILCNAD